MQAYKSKYSIFYLQSYKGKYDIQKEDFIKYSQMLFKEDNKVLYFMQEELMAIYTHSCFENIINIKDDSLVIMLKVINIDLFLWFCVSHDCYSGVDNILEKVLTSKVYATKNSDKIISVEMLNVYEKHGINIKQLTCPLHIISIPTNLLRKLLHKGLITNQALIEVDKIAKRVRIEKDKLLLLKNFI